MPETSTLALVLRQRPSGDGRTPREFIDVLVDSKRLLDRVGWEGADLVTPLGWGVLASQRSAIRQLQRDEPTSLASGRVLLFVCPECGDIGCGAIAVRIKRSGSDVTWSDFARENGYEDPSPIGCEPIRFSASDYWQALEGFVASWRSNKSMELTRDR
jgi:hypothetical protein